MIYLQIILHYDFNCTCELFRNQFTKLCSSFKCNAAICWIFCCKNMCNEMCFFFFCGHNLELAKWIVVDLLLKLLTYLLKYFFGAGRCTASESKQVNVNKDPASVLILFTSLSSPQKDTGQCRKSWGSSSGWPHWKFTLCGQFYMLILEFLSVSKKGFCNENI